MSGWKVPGFRRSEYLVPVLVVAVFGLTVGAAPREAWGQAAGDDACSSSGRPAVQLPATKLIIEHNATDQDTGVHGLFDGVNWTKLCVYDPDGRQVLVVEPTGRLGKQSISGIFFESAEPPNAVVSIEKLKQRFPEGRYSVRGLSQDGRRLRGGANFTHDIPRAPVITFPKKNGDPVSVSNLVVTWDHVTMTLDGKPLHRTGYEVIVTKDVRDDPHGFSRPVLSVHVPPSVKSVTIPSEFLEPRTTYELEVLVLEEGGNQTISLRSFKTE